MAISSFILTLRPRLPPELQDQIIDHLHSDKHALRACALVSREWRTSGQFHLFRSVRVSNPGALAALNGFLDSAVHLRGHIRSLEVRGASHPDDTVRDSQMILTREELATFVARLPRLTSLTLDGVWLSPARNSSSPLHSASPLPTTSPSLRNLNVKNIFTTPETLLDSITAFPGLRNLHADNVQWTYGFDHSELPPDTPVPRLESLTIGPGSSYNMLYYLLPTIEERLPLFSIRTLSICLDHLGAWYEVTDLLRSVSPHLEDLQLSLGSGVLVSEVSRRCLQMLGRIPFKALRSCTIALPSDRSCPTAPHRSWALLMMILPGLPAALRELTIVCQEPLSTLAKGVDAGDWEALEELLEVRRLGRVLVRESTE